MNPLNTPELELRSNQNPTLTPDQPHNPDMPGLVGDPSVRPAGADDAPQEG